MITTGPRPSGLLSLLGIRTIDFHQLMGQLDPPGLLDRLLEKCELPCLIMLTGKALDADPAWVRELIAVGKSKGWRLGAAPLLPPYHDWFDRLNFLTFRIERPAKFPHAVEFNDAIQDRWFMDGKLAVECAVTDGSDLAMVELIQSYTPPDIDLFVDARCASPVCKQALQKQPRQLTNSRIVL